MKMSQNSTLNFLIHDANGQPQMVKVVQNTSANPIKVKPNSIKLIKLPGEGSNQTPVFRAVQLNNFKASKALQVPVEFSTPNKNIVPKSEPVEIEEEILKETEQDITENQLEEAVSQFVTVTEPDKASCSSRSSLRNFNKTAAMSQRRRHDSSNDPPAEYTTKRRKHADKVGKGLRHFSMKVCEKVRNKGFTSYNEVADELVMEFANGVHGSSEGQQYDQKNIRRRVYDALNVLMAMNIISKEKKEIRWIGLPTNSVQECTALEKEKQNKIERIKKKTQQLQELIMQHISFKSLIERNKEAESRGVKPSPSSAIHLPFIVVNTSDKALIDCSISNDKTEYMFNFNKRFQIHDDIDILKRMGLLYGLDKGECTEEDIERAKSMVPKSLGKFVELMGRGLTSNLTTIVKEEAGEEGEDEDLDEEDDGEGDEEEAEEEGAGAESSDDSSDVDV